MVRGTATAFTAPWQSEVPVHHADNRQPTRTLPAAELATYLYFDVSCVAQDDLQDCLVEHDNLRGAATTDSSTAVAVSCVGCTVDSMDE